MTELGVFITVLPPIVAAAFTYLIARKRSLISERINKAKIDAEIQSKALGFVRGIMNDMRDEFHREIETLREENKKLRKEIEDNKTYMGSLQTKLTASQELIDSMRQEISTLRKALAKYEGKNDSDTI